MTCVEAASPRTSKQRNGLLIVHWLGRCCGEQTLARATVSSLLATGVDAVVYQASLSVAYGRYGVAAAAGAVAGAITNFLLNRHWAFDATHDKMPWQALRYVVVSLVTFFGLRVMLWALIELGSVGMRIAWLPAKILAFLLVSFPLQRVWVFRRRHQ
jgi:putative flippase GtrA